MAFQISGTTVINDSRKALLTSVNPGSYTNSNRPGSPSTGDVIYNSTENEIQFWDGSEWASL
jgi:hypothetical protein